MKRTLAVVSAGLRLPSTTRMLADRLADGVREELEGRGAQVDVDVVEVRDHAHDLVNHLMAGYPSPRLRRVFGAVTAADGLIVVTPTFTASYSGLFKMFFDCLEDTALVDKPVLTAATGGTGRHSLVLDHAVRPMFTYLRAVVVPTAVFAATDDWGRGSGDTQDPMVRRIGRSRSETRRRGGPACGAARRGSPRRSRTVRASAGGRGVRWAAAGRCRPVPRRARCGPDRKE